MKIKVWGCRGSLPTPGPQTIRYGGNGTCIEIRPHGTHIIIIDAGSGLRILGKELIKEKEIEKISFLMTHSHWDHLMGFPFFLPAYFSRFTIEIRGGPKAQDSLAKYLARQMEPPYFPVDFNLLKAKFVFGGSGPLSILDEDIQIDSIELSHPNGCYGYKFQHYGKTFVFLTDNELAYHHEGGLSTDEYVSFCKNADLLFHDAQYTDEEYEKTRTWGHSTFNQAIDLALAAGVKSLGFIHHDPDRTDDDLDFQVEKCNKRITDENRELHCFGVQEGMEIDL
ncbi:MAG: MBL fold metallo-hydrolase [Candidatus Riflebacteria bacterium]|nr:MBL fold metallo-hydrolase [Candidatus Riflebacteria bacterium]